MVCTYEVVENDGDTDGASIDAGLVALNSGTITQAGNANLPAVLTHTGVAADAVALSEGTGSFRDHEATDHDSRGSGALESSLTSVHPYARLEVSERLSVWGILGVGTGELEMEVDGEERWTTDTTHEMAAVGARSVLVRAPETGGLELGLRGDAVMQRLRSDRATGSDEGNLGAADAQTSRLRLALEGSRAFGDDGRTYTAGFGYRLGQSLDLTLDATRRESANDDAREHEIMLRTRMRW